MGHADLRVANKIFAGLPAGDERAVNLKSTAGNVDALVRQDPATFRNAWGGTWLGVNLDGVDRARLRELVEEAWLLAARKNVRGR